MKFDLHVVYLSAVLQKFPISVLEAVTPDSKELLSFILRELQARSYTNSKL